LAASAVCMPLGRAEEVFVRGDHLQEDRKELQMRRLRVRRP